MRMTLTDGLFGSPMILASCARSNSQSPFNTGFLSLSLFLLPKDQLNRSFLWYFQTCFFFPSFGLHSFCFVSTRMYQGAMLNYRPKKRDRASNTSPPKMTKPSMTRRRNKASNWLASERRPVGQSCFESREERHTEPEHGNGRLGSFLGALLDLVLGLASTGFLVLDELGVAPSLLEGLGLGAKGARVRRQWPFATW